MDEVTISSFTSITVYSKNMLLFSKHKYFKTGLQAIRWCFEEEININQERGKQGKVRRKIRRGSEMQIHVSTVERL